MVYLKRVVLSVVVVLMLVCFANGLKVSAMEQYIPIEAQRVAKTRYGEMVDLIRYKNVDFGVTIKSLQNSRLGSPVIVLDESREYQDEIYYFPVMNGNNEVVLVLSVMGTNKGWRCAMDTEYVEMLESVDYEDGDELAFYMYDNVCIAEDDVKRYLISNSGEKISARQIGDSSYRGAEDGKYKQMNRLKKVEIDSNANCGEIRYGAYVPMFSTVTDTARIMKLHNKQSQGEYDLCWAATIATIVNYRLGEDYTAMEVADMAGIGYDDGANISTMKDILWGYDDNYTWKSNVQLSFDLIKKNVNAKFPMAMGANPDVEGEDAHAVTLYGYGGDFVYLWNSGNSKSQLVEYSSTGITFPYRNMTYLCTKAVFACG